MPASVIPTDTTVAASIIQLASLALFLGLSVWLAVVDWREHRLPNRLVLAAGVTAIASQALQTVITGNLGAMMRSAITATVCFGIYLLLHVASRTKSTDGVHTGMGAGDVKLAAVLGLYLGWLSIDAAILGIAAGFVLGALFSLGLIVFRRGTRRSRVAFGPWMLAGAWLVLGASVVSEIALFTYPTVALASPAH